MKNIAKYLKFSCTSGVTISLIIALGSINIDAAKHNINIVMQPDKKPQLIFQAANSVLDNLSNESSENLNNNSDATAAMLEEAIEELDKLNNGNINTIANNKSSLVTNDSTKLMVFVSSSITQDLLKQYVAEANKYKAQIVFKGLPNNSFKEMIALISEIAEEQDTSGMLIDDEAFAKYGVVKVPTFVLVKETNCTLEQNCQVTFDKLAGNVGLKWALEQFAEKGELADEAKELLNNSNIVGLLSNQNSPINESNNDEVTK